MGDDEDISGGKMIYKIIIIIPYVLRAGIKSELKGPQILCTFRSMMLCLGGRGDKCKGKSGIQFA
jgi:hypothetical protein